MADIRSRTWLLLAVAIGAGACRSDPTGPSDFPEPEDRTTPPQLACPAPTSPQGGQVYYVAINEPGADNDRCDGLSPVNAGNGRCPFKDFRSQRTFRLLTDVAGVRVEVRAGVYTFAGEGLTVRGRGTSEADRVVLTAYQNEAVVFDGRNSLRELIRVSGRFTVLERVAFRNAAAYNVQVGGGSDHLIQCNRFLANASSDSLKAVESAGSTIVRYNDFSQWDSQAIDMADARDWTIADNDFHDARSPSANAIGAKFGSRNILIARNRFRNTRGLSFGGGSSAHANAFEAYNLVAEHNAFEDVPGAVVKFYSCSDCIVRDNDMRGVGGGFILGGDQFEGPSGCAGGCAPTRGAIVERNRLIDLRGNPANMFWVVYQKETAGLASGGNLYCTAPAQEAQFTIDMRAVSFLEWTRTMGTDSTSIAGTIDRFPCVGW